MVFSCFAFFGFGIFLLIKHVLGAFKTRAVKESYGIQNEDSTDYYLHLVHIQVFNKFFNDTGNPHSNSWDDENSKYKNHWVVEAWPQATFSIVFPLPVYFPEGDYADETQQQESFVSPLCFENHLRRLFDAVTPNQMIHVFRSAVELKLRPVPFFLGV